MRGNKFWKKALIEGKKGLVFLKTKNSKLEKYLFKKMKIVISALGESLDSKVATRFGRAPKFFVYDIQTETFTVIENKQNLSATQGAGIQAAQRVADTGGTCLITGHCGPKAFRVLNEAGIKVYTTEAITVKEALQMFKKGVLKQMDSADRQGH
jgi:predicted Fe-Mo cluster-binding NifX family protein